MTLEDGPSPAFSPYDERDLPDGPARRFEAYKEAWGRCLERIKVFYILFPIVNTAKLAT